MAGLAAISLQQRVDSNGVPYNGAKAFFYAADTLTAIAVYSDYALTTPHTNPVIATSRGVFPAIFIDDDVGFYRQRVTSSSGGVTLDDLTTLPVIGPAVVADAGETDPNLLLQTGMALWIPYTGTWAGMVRLNGRTIGSATSGASERANADTSDLYAFAYNNFSDTLCPVTGGRGSSAAADFALNKPLTLLDMRARGPFGLPDMGNSDSGAFSAISFTTGTATTAGATAGAATKTILQANLPNVSFTVSGGSNSHTAAGGANMLTNEGGGAFSGFYGTPSTTAFAIGVRSGTSDNAPTGQTAASGGSGTAIDKLSPIMLGSWFWKL